MWLTKLNTPAQYGKVVERYDDDRSFDFCLAEKSRSCYFIVFKSCPRGSVTEGTMTLTKTRMLQANYVARN